MANRLLGKTSCGREGSAWERINWTWGRASRTDA